MFFFFVQFRSFPVGITVFLCFSIGHGNDSNIHYKESTNSINSTTSSASVSSFDSTDQKIGKVYGIKK